MEKAVARVKNSRKKAGLKNRNFWRLEQVASVCFL
jgi:hypothetical protein